MAETEIIQPGRPISNRTWKIAQKKASLRVESKPLHAGFHRRMQKEIEAKQAKQIEKELRDQRQHEREVHSLILTFNFHISDHVATQTSKKRPYRATA